MAFTGLVACGGGGEEAATTTSPTNRASPGSTAPPATTTVAPVEGSGPVGGPVPPGFAAASVTFVSLQTGWVLGTAPCSSPPCTSILRTRDGGRSWVGIPAPLAEIGVDQTESVRHLRFADVDNGWAFGPDLWSTHDGGEHWNPVTLPGIERVSAVFDLAAAAGKAHVAVFTLGGVRILTTPVGSEAWEMSPTIVPVGAGPVPQAQIVLQGDAGWLVQVDRVVVGGARLTGGAWVPWEPPCLDAGGSAVLAAPTATDLVAVCDEGEWNARPRAVRSYFSSDGGSTFLPADVPVPLTSTYAVASGVPGTVVAAGTASGADPPSSRPPSTAAPPGPPSTPSRRAGGSRSASPVRPRAWRYWARGIPTSVPC